MLEAIRRWGRFLTVYIPDDYAPVLVGIVLAWEPDAPPRFWFRAALLLLGAIAASLFIHGSDNIVGFLHGVDRLAQAAKGSRKEPKLLVTGEVRLREAQLVTGALLVVMAVIGVYFALTSHGAGVVLGAIVCVLTAQYSVGLRLSYHGLGEAAVFLSGLGTPVAFILLSGRVEAAPLVIGITLGLFFAAVNVNSNAADHAFDLAAGRRTLAVRLGIERHRRVAVALVIAAWTALAAALVLRALPPLAAAAAMLLPCHVRQLDELFRGNTLAARRIGFRVLRCLFVLVAVAIAAERALARRPVAFSTPASRSGREASPVLQAHDAGGPASFQHAGGRIGAEPVTEGEPECP